MNYSGSTIQTPYWSSSINGTEDVDQGSSSTSALLEQSTLFRVHEKTSSLTTSFNVSLDITESMLTVSEAIHLYNMSAAEVNGTQNYTNSSESRNGTNLPQEGIRLEHQIPLYVIIFLLSVVGNILVIVTVVQNKKMRSVTNVFLLNLSVSDLLLAVFCMPFTLVPLLLKNFIFGEFMCVAIRYLQDINCSRMLQLLQGGMQKVISYTQLGSDPVQRSVIKGTQLGSIPVQRYVIKGKQMGSIPVQRSVIKGKQLDSIPVQRSVIKGTQLCSIPVQRSVIKEVSQVTTKMVSDWTSRIKLAPILVGYWNVMKAREINSDNVNDD
ncbi:hypothetical protein Btru_033753 [Bulinus truncatus]|nr:hypothetical protein Btru_033753 [Bulinus truncatus]